MIIAQILQKAKETIGLQGDMIGIEVLLAYVLQKGKEFLISHADFDLTHEQQQSFFDLFDRFFEGEPVAYLTQNKEFYGLDFYVDKRVLIPRPETELLVERALNCLKNLPAPRILDVGTGSGCIAVSLAYKLPGGKIVASDIEESALQVANMNVQRHQLENRITLVKSDLLSNIEGEFDLVVANLPYIGTKNFAFVSKEAQDFEPHAALFGGVDGLGLYEKLFQQLSKWKNKPVFLLGEFGFLQGEEIRLLIEKYFPANQLEIFEDYAKIERIFMIRF